MITIEVSNTYRGLSARVCEQLAHKHGLPRESIAICATHTHSGPVVGRLARIRANRNRKAASVGHGDRLGRLRSRSEPVAPSQG